MKLVNPSKSHDENALIRETTCRVAAFFPEDSLKMYYQQESLAEKQLNANLHLPLKHLESSLKVESINRYYVARK